MSKNTSMHQNLQNALEQAKLAKVQVLPRSSRRQMNLFEDDTSPEINFNGHYHLSAYQHHLDRFYADCKSYVALQDTSYLGETTMRLKRDLDMAIFEVKEFKRRYFPKDDLDFLMTRVEFVKTPRPPGPEDEVVKKR